MDTDAVLAKGTPADLTFDEFRNFQLRERNRKANQEDPDKLTTTSVGATTKEKPKGKESQISGATDNASAKASATQDRGGDVGAFLENAQVQSFIVILLTIDTFVAMGVLILGNHIASVNRAAGAEEFPGGADSAGTEASLPSEVYNLFFGMFSLSSLYQTLITFNSFVVAFFSFEVALVLVVFGTRATGHWGYLLDAIIVSGQVYGELSGAGQFSHLFNILRYWRLLRLVNYLVLNEQDLHDSTKAELVHAQTALQNAESNVKRLELEMLREQEARTAVDEMLQSYKEEVGTCLCFILWVLGTTCTPFAQD
jgi:hypothetical protein